MDKEAKMERKARNGGSQRRKNEEREKAKQLHPLTGIKKKRIIIKKRKTKKKQRMIAEQPTG